MMLCFLRSFSLLHFVRFSLRDFLILQVWQQSDLGVASEIELGFPKNVVNHSLGYYFIPHRARLIGLFTFCRLINEIVRISLSNIKIRQQDYVILSDSFIA